MGRLLILDRKDVPGDFAPLRQGQDIYLIMHEVALLVGDNNIGIAQDPQML